MPQINREPGPPVGILAETGFSVAERISSALDRTVNSLSEGAKQVNSALNPFAQPTAKNANELKEDVVTTQANISGPLAALEPETSPFIYTQLQYPIGDMLVRYPYYITFHFNVPTTASRFNKNYQGVTVNEDGTIDTKGSLTGGESLNTRDKNRRAKGTAQPTSFSLGSGEDALQLDLSRKTVRTSHTIRLYMPDTLQWNFKQSWRDPHLADSGLVNTLGPMMSIIEGVQTAGWSGITSGAAQAGKVLAARLADKIPGGLPDGVALSSMGYTLNPLIDVIYTSPELRTFTMEFNFAPRSAEEALEVRRIIRAFKFFSAPEVPEISGYGYLMIPPGDIDIEFSVTTIGKISTCILQNIDIDYAPNGFAAYQNPQDITDGMPVNIRMRLEFTETEYITKDLVLKGY